MKFNTHTHSFTKLKLWHTTNHNNNNRLGQYRDLVPYNDNYLYALPYNGTKVVKINMTTLNSITVGDDLGYGDSKWISSIVGRDNCIYGIPCRVSRVLRFDPSNNTCTFIGWRYDGVSKWWGCCTASNGRIYAAPCNATNILKITIPRWNIVKEHIMLRWLVDHGRASSVTTIHSNTKTKKNNRRLDIVKDRILSYLVVVEDCKSSAIGSNNNGRNIIQSCYRNFIQCSNNDIFWLILQFL